MKKLQQTKGGIVYSTNPNFNFQQLDEEIVTLPPQQQNLYIWRDSKSRKGKTVTLIKGFVGNESDMMNLSKKLKTLCGTGGSCKDGEIMIQGDFRNKILEFLHKSAYKAKLAGG